MLIDGTRRNPHHFRAYHDGRYLDTEKKVPETGFERGYNAGVPNHLDDMVEGLAEVDRCMDDKDARWTTSTAGPVLPNGKVHKQDSPAAKFVESVYDLGDGDFVRCHRSWKEINYKSWNCVNLDRTRKGPRLSYEHCKRI